MTPADTQSSLVDSLADQFAGPLLQSRRDLLDLSNLHPDFLKACSAFINTTSPQRKGPSSGEIFSHLVMKGLELPDNDRRMLAAAWLALHMYMSVVDHELDQKGYLDGPSLIAASALMGWGVATLSRYTAGTPFASVFTDNINKAFAGQYDDMRIRSDKNADRRSSDSDKNRALIAAVAGFSAAAGISDDRLIRSAEALLGTFQILDDLQDLQEDCGEDNITVFVRIARECASAAAPLTRSQMYSAIIRDPRTKEALQKAAEGIEKALLMLDGDRDRVLVEFLIKLRVRNTALVQALADYQRDPSVIKEPEVLSQIKEMFMSS